MNIKMFKANSHYKMRGQVEEFLEKLHPDCVKFITQSESCASHALGASEWNITVTIWYV